MKYLLLGLFTSLLSAQTSVSVAYDAFGEIRLGEYVMGAGGIKVTVTTAGAWTLSKGTCTRLIANKTSGTGNDIIKANLKAGIGTAIPTGSNWVTGSCSASVNGEAFTVNYKIFRRRNPIFVTDMNGSQSLPGSKTGSELAYNNNVDYTNAYPPYDGVALPAVGGTWTDPLYGGVYKRVSSKAHLNYNSAMFSKNGTYMLTEDGIREVATNNIVAPAPWLAASGPVCSGSMTNVWFANRPESSETSGYCIGTSANTFKTWSINLVGGTITDGGVIYTHSANIYNADNSPGTGGSGNITGLDDAIFFPSADSTVCYFELWRPTKAPICAAQDHTVRSTQISPLPETNGDRYMHFVSTGATEHLSTFRLRNGALTMMPKINRIDFDLSDAGTGGYGIPCVDGQDCSRAGHNTAVFFNGQAGRMGAGDGVAQSYGGYYYGMYGPKFSFDAIAGLMIEAGGGLITSAMHADHYIVASQNAPTAFATGDGGDSNSRGTSCTLSSGTLTCEIAGSLSTCAYCSNPDGGYNQGTTNIFSVGNRVLLAGFSQNAWNGYWTIATTGSPSAQFITITGMSGAGTDLVGQITLAVANTQGGYPARAHHIFGRLDTNHWRITGKAGQSTNASYAQLTLPKISPDGRYAAVNDGHFGYPATYGLRTVDAGWRVSRKTRRNDLDDTGQTYSVTGVTNGLDVKVWVNAARTCTLTYSKQWDYLNGTDYTFNPGSVYRTHSITSLTPGDIYYTQLVCDGVDPTTNTVKPKWLMARFDDIVVK